MIVGTHRDAEVRRSEDLARLIADIGRDAAQLPLAGLAASEVSVMVTARAEQDTNASLVADLHRITAGNPLFVDGIVRVLIAEGKLGESARLDLGRFKLPENVRGAMRTRLAALPAELVSVLRVASGLGLEFELSVIVRLTQRHSQQLQKLMHEACDSGILAQIADSRHRFTHPLIREALYADVANRDELHGLIAEAIADLYRFDLAPHFAELAHHFRQAGNLEKGIDYSISAGDAAYIAFAYEEAISHWRAAEQLLEQGSDTAEQRAGLLERIGTTMDVVESDLAKRIECLTSALKLYVTMGHREGAARLHARLGQTLSALDINADLAEAVRHYRSAETLLSGKPEGAELAELYISMADSANYLLDYESGLERSARAMEIAERIGNQELWVRAATTHGDHLGFLGRLTEASAIFARAASAASRLGSPKLRARIAMAIANMFVNLWDPCSAREALVSVLETLQKSSFQYCNLAMMLADAAHLGGRLGDLREVASSAPSVSSHWPFLARHLGDWNRAEAACWEIVENVRRSGNRHIVGEMPQWVAEIRLSMGDPRSAQTLLEEALAFRADDPHREMQMRPLLAISLTLSGKLDPAEAELSRCREIIASGEDWRGVAGLLYRAEAMLATARGRHDTAEAAFRTSTDMLRRYAVPFEEAETLYRWGITLSASGERVRAEEKFEDAIEIYRRIGAGQPWIDRVERERHKVPAKTAEPKSEANHLRLEGAYWTVVYEGRLFRLKDSKGVRYLARLLQDPNHEFHVFDLIGAQYESLRANSGWTSADLGDAGVVLDSTAKAAYSSRLEDLTSELEEAESFNDLGRAARARDEMETIANQIAGGFGLGGRARKAASNSERARLAVTKRIKSAIAQIRELDDGLGRHLATAISTGVFCSYKLDPTHLVHWTF